MADLLAVYDFAVSRISFDYFNYLALADLARRRAGVEQLRLLIVPAPGDGFHANVQYDLDQKVWRLTNLVLDGARLLPSCAGIMLAASRDHARELIAAHQGPLHPAGYTLDNPIAHWENGRLVIATNAGENLQVFRASAQARTYARQWLDARRNGRKAIALTLREASFNAQRNVALGAWSDFARYLEKRGYFPFILRDIETALDEPAEELRGIAECPAAVFNLDLRLAIYEQAYFNVSVFNGPVGLSQLSRFPRFLAFAAEENSPRVHAFFEEMGYGFGETPAILNKMQRYAWRTATLTTLIDDFSAMEETLRAHEAADCPETDYDQDPSNIRSPLVLGRHFLNTRNWGMLNELLLDAETRGTKSPELSALGREADVVRADLTNEEALYRHAIDLQSFGKFDAAIVILQRLLAGRPSGPHPFVDLGRLLEATDRPQDAMDVYRNAIARGITSPAIIYRLAHVAEGLGDFASARVCFETLLDIAGTNESLANEMDLEDLRARLAKLIAREAS